MNTHKLEVAMEIQRQLFSQGKMKVYSWGSHNWQGSNDFLIFNVQAFKMVGKVKITYLIGNDLYKIEFIKDGVVIETYDNVYYDGLVSLIDDYIEYTGDSYPSDVANAKYSF
jgi:hypothetical protein